MRLAYISPSVLPSRSANSIHVLQQCDALARIGVEVTLFAKRQAVTARDLRADVMRAYGLNMEHVRLSTVYTPWSRANNITIAMHAIFRSLFRDRFDAVLSRNLFASFFLALFSRIPLIIEVHQLEKGIRGWMQRMACSRTGVMVVVISEQLRSDLQHTLGHLNAPIRVLHDAAPEASGQLSVEERLAWREEYIGTPADRGKFVCGYVGHLYPGRGIEIIEALARECPDILFLVIGGNDGDVEERRGHNAATNLRFIGHVSHPVARRAMSAVDLLLMPYQEKVSIGLDGHDTGRWMSPMKMFEYMASGTPFIASDLAVLREVLREGETAILAPARSVEAWKTAILALKDDPRLRMSLARRAYEDYQNNYTWRRRAERIVECIGQ